MNNVYVLLNQASYDDAFSILGIYKNKNDAEAEAKVLTELKQQYETYWVEEWELK